MRYYEKVGGSAVASPLISPCLSSCPLHLTGLPPSALGTAPWERAKLRLHSLFHSVGIQEKQVNILIQYCWYREKDTETSLEMKWTGLESCVSYTKCHMTNHWTIKNVTWQMSTLFNVKWQMSTLYHVTWHICPISHDKGYIILFIYHTKQNS